MIVVRVLPSPIEVPAGAVYVVESTGKRYVSEDGEWLVCEDPATHRALFRMSWPAPSPTERRYARFSPEDMIAHPGQGKWLLEFLRWPPDGPVQGPPPYR